VADNTELNAGSGGDVIATDDIGGVKHQLVKVEFGAADSATQVEDASPLPVEIGNGTNQASVDSDGALRVDEPNVISTNNSTTATLGISANFTGTADDVSDFSAVTIQLDASHDSATDGMTFEFSTDNSNWDDVYSFTYTAADGARRFQFPTSAQYFRINYTNGGTGQSHFRVQTILHRHPVTSSIHRAVDNVDPDRSAQLVKSVMLAQINGSGDFIPIQADASGNFKVDVEDLGGTAIDLNTGNAAGGTQRVVLADDQPAVTVDGSGVTQPVSAASLPLPAGAATSAAQLPDGHNVTVDNAAGASAVNVQDGGNSITVDAPTATPVAVEIGDGADTAGVTAAGELSVAVGPALPAGDNNIGNVDVVTQPARDRTTDNVGVALQSDALMNDATVMTPKFANIDTASSGNNAIVAAVGGATIRVLAVFVAGSGAVDIYFNDGTANLLGGTRLVKLDNTGAAGAVGFSLPFNPLGWFETAAVNRPINLNLSAAVGVAGCLVYVEV
jgi:hypothetical protein